MKELLYRKESVIYENIKYKESCPIDYKHKRTYNNHRDSFSSYDVDSLGQIPTKRHPLFLHDSTFNDKESFDENFNNPMWSISKGYFMVVVERDGDKVKIKTFHGSIHRRGGVKWFQQNKNVNFISVNVRTGDVYVGDITGYHLKRKCRKKIRRNYFIDEPIGNMLSRIKHNFRSEDSNKVAIDAITTFMNEIDGSNEFVDLTFGQRLFKFYLNKRGIKFSNNFYVFTGSWFGNDIKKILKKNDNRMIDSLMVHYGISGRQVKKALHNCEYLNIQAYHFARTMFGEDWLNQNENLILGCFNFQKNILSPPEDFHKFISNEELKRVFKLFKEVILTKTLDYFTFYDHIRIYTELKNFGEDNLKWMSSDNSGSNFRREHLDWSDKLEHYRQGNYTLIYPDYSYELLEKPIKIDDDVYFPVLLDDSYKYNMESVQQSNCVKTYIGKCSSIIISVRKGGVDSSERATIEYVLFKDLNRIKIERRQSLGRFNYKLDVEWDDILFKLDEIMLLYIQDNRFDTVKINKKCKNGVELKSTSNWDDSGKLVWTENKINKTYNNSNNYF